jgi:endoglucanase
MKKIEKLNPTASLKRDTINLSQINGIPAHEEKVVDYIKESFKGAGLKTERDGLGSLAIIKEGKKGGPVISFTAHMDEVGFMITKIEKSGFIRFTPVGG